MKPSAQQYDQPGDPPGIASLRHRQDSIPPVISIIDFHSSEITEISPDSLEEIRGWGESKNITWVHVQGQATPKLLDVLSETYGLHSLALEDVVSHRQRPKMESYDDECFIVMKIPVLTDEGLDLQQVSFFLGKSFVISFHGGPSDMFEPVRTRLRDKRIGPIRSRGADYLLYALIDLVVDLAFPVLESMADRIEDLEDAVLANPSHDVSLAIHGARRNIVSLRHGLAPQRDLLNSLIRDDHAFIQKKTKVYLRDCHDHMVRILESLESYRELALGVQEIYMSGLNQRMNDVMKVLTVIATIFIPLSFVTGLYGMNFDSSASPWNMPELHAYYGYPILVSLLFAVAVGMLSYFKLKKWF